MSFIHASHIIQAYREINIKQGIYVYAFIFLSLFFPHDRDNDILIISRCLDIQSSGQNND